MSGNWEEGDYRDPDHGCPDCAAPPERAIEYRRWCTPAIFLNLFYFKPSLLSLLSNVFVALPTSLT